MDKDSQQEGEYEYSLEEKFNKVKAGQASIDIVLEDKEFISTVTRICGRYRQSLSQHGLEVNDLSQEAYMKVWEHRDKVEGNKENIPNLKSFWGWTYIIVRNTYYDELRKRSKYPIDEKQSENLEFFVAPFLDAYSMCLLSEFKEHLQSLPPELKRPLENWLEGQSLRIIAKSEGCSHVAIRNRIRKALEPFVGPAAAKATLK